MRSASAGPPFNGTTDAPAVNGAPGSPAGPPLNGTTGVPAGPPLHGITGNAITPYFCLFNAAPPAANRTPTASSFRPIDPTTPLFQRLDPAPPSVPLFNGTITKTPPDAASIPCDPAPPAGPPLYADDASSRPASVAAINRPTSRQQ